MLAAHDIACSRARQSKENIDQGKADQGQAQKQIQQMQVHVETNYRAEQNKYFRASQDQEHDMNKTMQGHRYRVGPVSAERGHNQTPGGVKTGP